MIAVQMRKHDAVDLVRIETLRLEGDERRCPATDEQLAFRCFEKEAGVEPAAGAEGITRSNDRQPHGQADAVYTENSRPYYVTESPNVSSDDRAVLLLPARRLSRRRDLRRAVRWPVCLKPQ